MGSGRSVGVEEPCVEVSAHNLGCVLVFSELLAVPLGLPLTSVEAQHQAHCGGLSGSIRPEETRHHAWLQGECQVVDRRL